ncbi:MAG TPA: hypothetical protein VI583_03265 [Cyclobacteriaceae bacterium]|nr:hypothetical protein [Cyclobacteriaceae bacterium]
MLLSIPEPVLLNCWKHHLGFIIDRIREYKSETQLKKLKSDLLNIGNSTTDLYTGQIGSMAAAELALGEIHKNGIFFKDQYVKWIRDSAESYKCREFPDGSVWVFRIGDEPERYVHIHPGRNVPHTLRVKANVLKSVIGAMVLSRIFDENPHALSTLNNARRILTGLSPVKTIQSDSEFSKMLEVFSARIHSH